VQLVCYGPKADITDRVLSHLFDVRVIWSLVCAPIGTSESCSPASSLALPHGRKILRYPFSVRVRHCPIPDRFGAATLVEAGKEKLLFDVGRGATIRLNQIGVSLGAINAVFLTHFHSDHTSGIPDLWLTGWIGRYYGNRQSPFRVIGPKGTLSLMQNLERAYADDIRTGPRTRRIP
jgi:ribonuclease BN (tRNA processing enzyme)